jgi:hypothetical protein
MEEMIEISEKSRDRGRERIREEKRGKEWSKPKELRINVNLYHGKDVAKFLLLSRRRDIGLNC